MIVFLLSGWSGSGKDAVGQILSSYGVRRKAFADPLKRQVAQELQIPLQWTHTPDGKRSIVQGKSVRDHLIQRGQEIRKERQDPGYFAWQICLDILDDELQQLQGKYADPQRYVITDWRLPEELETLGRLGLEVELVKVRINRPGMPITVDDSYTEHQLDNYPFDAVIENSGTWSQLHEEVRKKLSKWLPAETSSNATFPQTRP